MTGLAKARGPSVVPWIFSVTMLLLPIWSSAAECEIRVVLRAEIYQSGIATSAARSALSRLANVKLVPPEDGEWLFDMNVAALTLKQPVGTVGYAISIVTGYRAAKEVLSTEAQQLVEAHQTGPQWFFVSSSALPAGIRQVREVVELAVAHFDNDILEQIPRRNCAELEREEQAAPRP